MRDVTSKLAEEPDTAPSRFVPLLLLPLLFLGTDRSAQADENQTVDFADIRQSIRARMVDQAVPSIAVAVARDSKIIWEEGFGWANREKRIRATEHTMYSLASVSKPITATGLMVLKQRGLVDLDHAANEYLGDAKLTARVGEARGATLRRLANHTAGLPTHARNFYNDEPWRRPSMEETIVRYGNLVRPPGEVFDYSNLGYGILDYVITRRSGKDYVDFMRQEVFLPLGMTRASVNIGPGLEEYAAVRYGPDGLPIPFFDSDHRGASAVYCSAHDLVRFGQFHLKCCLADQKAILSDENLDAAKAPGDESVAREHGYGLGWYFSEVRGYRKISAAGGTAGASAQLTLIPTKKLAVVVLCNTGSNLPSLVENEILSILLREPGAETPWSAKPGIATKTPAKPTESAKLAGEWRGCVHTYQGEVPLRLWFKPSGDIHVRLGDQLRTLLNRVRRRGNSLSGLMTGDIGTTDANRGGAYDLYLELTLREERLTGDVFTVPRPGKREGSLLSYWVEFKPAKSV